MTPRFDYISTLSFCFVFFSLFFGGFMQFNDQWWWFGLSWNKVLSLLFVCGCIMLKDETGRVSLAFTSVFLARWKSVIKWKTTKKIFFFHHHNCYENVHWNVWWEIWLKFSEVISSSHLLNAPYFLLSSNQQSENCDTVKILLSNYTFVPERMSINHKTQTISALSTFTNIADKLQLTN